MKIILILATISLLSMIWAYYTAPYYDEETGEFRKRK